MFWRCPWPFQDRGWSGIWSSGPSWRWRPSRWLGWRRQDAWWKRSSCGVSCLALPAPLTSPVHGHHHCHHYHRHHHHHHHRRHQHHHHGHQHHHYRRRHHHLHRHYNCYHHYHHHQHRHRRLHHHHHHHYRSSSSIINTVIKNKMVAKLF